MKKLVKNIIVLVICLGFIQVQAQVSPVDKEMAQKLENNRKNAAQQTQNISNTSFNYYELVVKDLGGKYIIEEKKIDKKKLGSDKNMYLKINFLNDLQNLLNKGRVNLVSELGNQGFKIVSHSFIAIQNGEKHIYILEL